MGWTGSREEILALQQQGELTIREAAAKLGLTYEGYLKLLEERRLPASHDDLDSEGFEVLRAKLRSLSPRS